VPAPARLAPPSSGPAARKCPSGAPSSLISSGDFRHLALRVDGPPSGTAPQASPAAKKQRGERGAGRSPRAAPPTHRTSLTKGQNHHERNTHARNARPGHLTVDINVRKDAALTADFIASIKEHGVMEPVIAHRKDDGTVHVLMGQRRTRAAVEAERPLIPVMIIDSPEEAERIVTQVVENIQRAELTEADEADAYHQLSLIGVSAAAIAKKTGRTKTTVESALKAKASTTGAAALDKGYTIEEALSGRI
jgi:hypothetical protein